MKKSHTYREAGVDIEKAEKSLANVRKNIARTHNSHVLKDIGAFGGFYELPSGKYKKPVLISSTDGVGTKLKVAMMMNRHDTVGQDLVNHCINDIAVCGAQPLFFLDYYGCGILEIGVFEQIVDGLTTACQQAGLPLIGGETAEMPDVYAPGDYDLVGTIVGIVEKDNIIDGQTIQQGDILIGVASTGLHTNGFSLARKVLFSSWKPGDYVAEIGNTLGDELLRIHRNYLPVITEITSAFPVKGMAHITGGGLYKNTIRVVPQGLKPAFNWSAWPVPPIFTFIREQGDVPVEDMRQTFNMGIGLVFILDDKYSGEVLKLAEKFEDNFYSIGTIVPA
ncbi:MAG: phosphoribosylformylglycinamidine cyclo-ligase [Calditrichaeota bacterium]|nr:phosphoribosylformylglycinamidine cyclo-ligase [Calditrichota bacterium]RQW04881.1 MAG: phosphoribosylformylglycinamidine cyclo-ligase [Calditrichota bacterium]